MTGGAELARVFVPGRARTKGHIQPTHVRGTAGRPCRFGGGKDRPELQEWMRTLVASIKGQLGIRLGRVAARGGSTKVVRVDGGAPLDRPIQVDCFFRFDRTEARRSGELTGEVWPTHDTPWPTALSIGDEDTLRRAVLDALVKAGVIADDRWSMGGLNFKRWCREGEQAGVLAVVREAPDLESLLAAEVRP